LITRQPWGEVDGAAVDLFTLSAGGGMTVAVSTFGGVVESVCVPSRGGEMVNVALGYGGLSEYVSDFAGVGASFFGAIIGRVANRIARHSFSLDGRRYELAGNDGPDDSVTLHGGPGGYHREVWHASVNRSSLRLSHVDPDGRNGFPGTVRVSVSYGVTRDNALRIVLRAVCDAPTVVNLTNHTYFNLAGEGSGDVYDQLLALNASTVQPVDSRRIPVGFAGVARTPFDFRAMKPIGRDLDADAIDGWAGEQLAIAGGYDHNWVLAGAGYRLAAVALDPGTGIALWVYTDQPGLQLYTANHLAGDLVGTSGRACGPGAGFALETQAFPDAPNHIGEPGWPSVVLRPGDVLTSQTTYRFTVAGPEFAERIRF
jgi:aldose 1-epimerase